MCIYRLIKSGIQAKQLENNLIEGTLGKEYSFEEKKFEKGNFLKTNVNFVKNVPVLSSWISLASPKEDVD